eukprot:scaffold42_cov432-Pavlova_lutheri.AAC.3
MAKEMLPKTSAHQVQNTWEREREMESHQTMKASHTSSASMGVLCMIQRTYKKEPTALDSVEDLYNYLKRTFKNQDPGPEAWRELHTARMKRTENVLQFLNRLVQLSFVVNASSSPVCRNLTEYDISARLQHGLPGHLQRALYKHLDHLIEVGKTPDMEPSNLAAIIFKLEREVQSSDVRSSRTANGFQKRSSTATAAALPASQPNNSRVNVVARRERKRFDDLDEEQQNSIKEVQTKLANKSLGAKLSQEEKDLCLAHSLLQDGIRNGCPKKLTTLRPVTTVTGTEPGARPAATPVNKDGKPVSLHSLSNDRPRHEFLAAETYFGKKPKRVRTQAYLDTLASYCFISERLFTQLQQADPKGLSWQYTSTTFNYNVAVGQQVHTAPVIRARFSIDGFQAHTDFGVAPLETFDCILGAAFCHKYLSALDWQNHRMILRTSDGVKFTVYGDHLFISSRKLDLIVPRSEARKAVKDPGCLLLMVQPVDATPELASEDSDFSNMHSHVSGEWPLNDRDKQRLDDLINRQYGHLFEARTELPPERVPGESFRIQVEEGSTPQYRNYYRLSPQQQVALKELVAEYVEAGKMDLCAGSSWGAHVILVPKKDGGWRVVFDYRLLNNVTVKDRYPLPRIHDYLQNIKGAKYFSSLDALDGFHQVRMHPDDIEKIAVVTPFGSYVWKVMPMGAANAPAMFQRMMNRVFGHLLYLKVYMDDILVHSETIEDHFKHLEEFFATCERADIRLKRSNCHFFMSTLEWVGFRIRDGQLACTDHLLSKIEQFPRPRSQRENMAFLGLCQFYMRFVPHYAERAAPLTELNQGALKHNFTSYWKQPQEEAYQRLIQALTTAPVLALFNEDRPIRVKTDASDVGMGAVLMQQDQQGNWKPVEYWSKKFNTAQQNYHPAKKETCAIMYALQHWRHLLFGQMFTVITDNKASQFISTKATEQLSPREMRWIERLAYFAPFRVEYRPGT